MLKKMSTDQQPFSKVNFWLMGGCCILIIVGFLLMVGGGSTIEGGFDPDIFSFRRIVVGPFLAFLGFLLMAFAIFADTDKVKNFFKNRKSKDQSKVANPNS